MPDVRTKAEIELRLAEAEVAYEAELHAPRPTLVAEYRTMIRELRWMLGLDDGEW